MSHDKVITETVRNNPDCNVFFLQTHPISVAKPISILFTIFEICNSNDDTKEVAIGNPTTTKHQTQINTTYPHFHMTTLKPVPNKDGLEKVEISLDVRGSYNGDTRGYGQRVKIKYLTLVAYSK